MIFEHRTYEVRPGMTDRYLEYYESEGLQIQSEHLGEPVAFFATEVGRMNRVIHIWQFESFEDRARRRHHLHQDLRWPPVLERLREMTVHQENAILRAATFSRIR